VRSLLEVVAVRVWALELGLSEVTQKGQQIVLRFFEDRQPGSEFAGAMMRAWGEKVRFLQGPPPGLSFAVAQGQGPTALKSLLPSLARYATLSSRELTHPG
jgi:hypothetical protein